MHIYEIGYFSHEESHYIQLMHEEKFSQEQLEEKILACVPDIVKRIWDDNLDPEYTDLDEGLEPPSAAKSRLRIDFPAIMGGVYDHDKEDLVSTLRQLLCERFGFVSLTYDAAYYRWGWGDLISGDWDYEDPDADVRARLAGTVRDALREYLGRHPEILERFGVADAEQLIGMLTSA